MHITAALVRSAIEEMDPKLKADDPAFRAAAVLLAFATTTHKSAKAIARALVARPRDVKAIMRRLKANRVLGQRYVHSDWTDPETGGVAFWMDVNVGLGLMARGES